MQMRGATSVKLQPPLNLHGNLNGFLISKNYSNVYVLMVMAIPWSVFHSEGKFSSSNIVLTLNSVDEPLKVVETRILGVFQD